MSIEDRMLLQHRFSWAGCCDRGFVAFCARKLTVVLANVLTLNQAAPTVMTNYFYGLHYFGLRQKAERLCKLNTEHSVG